MRKGHLFSTHASLYDTPQVKSNVAGSQLDLFPRSSLSALSPPRFHLKPETTAQHVRLLAKPQDVVLDPNLTILKNVIGGEMGRGMGAESGRCTPRDAGGYVPRYNTTEWGDPLYAR